MCNASFSHSIEIFWLLYGKPHLASEQAQYQYVSIRNSAWLYRRIIIAVISVN